MPQERHKIVATSSRLLYAVRILVIYAIINPVLRRKP